LNAPKKKHLLVEGECDKRVIPYLMEANGVLWPDDPKKWPVTIIPHDGIENMFSADGIPADLNLADEQIVGIIVDADTDALQRWQQVRHWCLGHFPDLPDRLSAEGLIAENGEGLKLGVWIMPDNDSPGMLEDFLVKSIPENEESPLLQYAEEVCREAKDSHNAPYRKSHATKAKVHTWLAWQDEPGRQLHQAIQHKLLQPTSPYAALFVAWFKELFELN